MEHRIATARIKPQRLWALLAQPGDMYGGTDAVLARRIAVPMWTFGALLAAVLQIFYPPTLLLGDLGWVMAAGSCAVAFGIVWVLADERRELGFDFLYAIGFVGVGLVALVEYGAGGRVAPYHEIYMFFLIGAALVHPPRRVLWFLGVIAVAMLAPLLYAPASVELGDVVTELLLWTGLVAVLMVLIATIRVQRRALQQESHDARQLARVDALTGLGNRRAFDEALDAEMARSRRSGAALSLIVADLNGFKEINDRFGHVMGDDCLRQAAAALREAVRRPDLCFRWGGDEFAILLTGADGTVGAALATRLEDSVAGSCTRPDGEPLRLTCGSAALDPSMSAAEAVARSDATLLAIKERNRVSALD